MCEGRKKGNVRKGECVEGREELKCEREQRGAEAERGEG